MQIQSGGASVCHFSGQWGVGDRAGQRGPCRGWPPRGWGDVHSFPKDPELFAIPRASVWKTKTQAKKFLAKMMAAEEEDKEDDADADDENDGDEGNDGDGDEGAEWGWTWGRFGCYRG